MFHQTDGLSHQSPLRPLSVLVFHLLLTRSCQGHSQLIGPPQPIVAGVGDDIILPCHLKPEMDVTAETLEWTRRGLDPRFVSVWRSGQDLVKVKNPSYRGRTSLFINELKKGNISLKLSKVQLSDQGTYDCDLPLLNKQSSVKLVVALSTPSSPVISLAGKDRKRGNVVLQCESKGWYPEPEVLWLDSEGNLLPAGPTETVRGPDVLYTVSSRLTVEKRHSNNFTCRVQQKNINQTRETHICISGDFFEVLSSSAPIIITLCVFLALCNMFIFAVFIFVHKWRQTIMTKRSHEDETDEREREPLRTEETVQTRNKKTGEMEMKHVSWNPYKWFKDERQEREKAEKEVKSLKKEVEMLIEEKQSSKRERQQLQTQLETKIDKLEEDNQAVNAQLGKTNEDLKETHLHLKKKTEEISQLQKENKKLKAENKRSEKELQIELEMIKKLADNEQALHMWKQKNDELKSKDEKINELKRELEQSKASWFSWFNKS